MFHTTSWFVNIHQDIYRKHCTSPPRQPHLLDQNPQYLHSYHNKYKCQPDSPYPRNPGTMLINILQTTGFSRFDKCSYMGWP